MNETITYVQDNNTSGTSLPIGTGTQWIPNTTITQTNSGTYVGPLTPYQPYSGSIRMDWNPAKPKKPRKPRAKKEVPAHEKEMKEAEAKWKKILDGKKK